MVPNTWSLFLSPGPCSRVPTHPLHHRHKPKIIKPLYLWLLIGFGQPDHLLGFVLASERAKQIACRCQLILEFFKIGIRCRREQDLVKRSKTRHTMISVSHIPTYPIYPPLLESFTGFLV